MIYLPILLLWFAVPAEKQTGTYFVKRTEAYASYNSWILTFTVDIEPHKRELRNIAHELDGCKLVYQDFHKALHSGVSQSNSTNVGYSVIQDIELMIAQKLAQFHQKGSRRHGSYSTICW